MQIKTQLDIKLSQEDIVIAIEAFLASHGHRVTSEELQNIKFVNTRVDGVTASLTVSNESDTAETITPVDAEEPTPVAEPEPELIEPSTVEDVMPSVDEVKELVEPAVDEEPVTSRPLFSKRPF